MMVEQESGRDAVLQVLSDEYMRAILCSTISNAKSMVEISNENGIPISTCYRRVHELVNFHLLKTEKTVITSNGKKYETFRSTLRAATITLLSGKLSVDVVMNPNTEDKLQGMLESMRDGSTNAVSKR